METAVVVIPVYKETLSETEKISLSQVHHVLSKYPIVFAAPERMRKFLSHRAYNAEFFHDDNFSSILQYSKMLLSSEFYERFSEYEYMLLYQLDAFVFSDRLQEFCDMNYDYIGAPWGAGTNMYKCSRIFVGNGGFSLRRVSRTAQVLRENSDKVTDLWEEWGNRVGEDAFFAFFGADRKYDYFVAPTRIAKKFALEFNTHHIFKELRKNLPFGCHAWPKRDFVIWAPLIAEYGYYVERAWPEVRGALQRTTLEYRQFNAFIYLSNRFIRKGKFYPRIGAKILSGLSCDCIGIWGMGMIGERVFNLFKLLGIRTGKLYAREQKEFKGEAVGSPDEILLHGPSTIVIAIRDYWIAMEQLGGEMACNVRLIPYERFMWYVIHCYINARDRFNHKSLYITPEEVHLMLRGKKVNHSGNMSSC